ncbi:MAG TPA: rhodanese-like domain-containing protein [Ktedonobacterales bacterium]
MQPLSNQASVPQVTPEQAREKQQQGAVLLDVREPDEWREGHVPGAVHIPLGSLGARYRELDPSQEIVTVCRSGVRSTTALKILNKAGFTHVHNLTGGMLAWAEKKLPVTK